LTLNQYRAGTVDFTAVITAQANSLASQQASITILQSRLVASVDLIEALGGGWIPSRCQPRPSRERGTGLVISHWKVGSKMGCVPIPAGT